ncbi:MAG: PP0621 family protein [Chromatiales bacterium]|nr:PP0621 family protein [Chromatiales bacterium]
MTLIRLIALALLFWLLYRLILNLLSKVRRSSASQSQEPAQEKMVRCERCDLHIPYRDAVEKNGRYFCCIEHQRATDNWKRDN